MQRKIFKQLNLNMERTNSQQDLTPAEIFRPQAELNLSQDDQVELESQDLQVRRRGQGPISQNFMESSSQNARTPKILSSQTQQFKKSQSKALPVTKVQITQEDVDRLAQFRKVLEKGKEFRERSKKLDFATPISQQEQQVVSPNAAKKGVWTNKNASSALSPHSKKSEIEHLLEAINEIVQADQLNKHQVEVEQVDKITRVISSARQGENCRDVLRYVSNLRKNFNESLQALEAVTNQQSEKFNLWNDLQTNHNNALSAEIERARQLSDQLKKRQSENTQLKHQLESCLNLLSQKDADEGQPKQAFVSDPLLDEADNRREQDMVSISSKIESELQSNNAHSLVERFKTQLDSFLNESRSVRAVKRQLEMQLEAQTRNLTYLEEQLAANLTEREEQVVEMKSQIILYKQKARTYKLKLKTDIEELKKEVAKGEVELCFKEKQEIEAKLNQVQTLLTQREAELVEHRQQANRHITKMKKIEKEHNFTIEERETKIQHLQEQIQRAEREASSKLQIQVQRNQSERREITVLEQEQQVKDLRLEYLESNQKKIQQQKKFLEEQISKDIKEMQQQMIKTSLEIKKDQLISSQSAMHQLEGIYSLMQNSLRHVTRVVSFMTFDQDSQMYGNISSLSEHEQEMQLQDGIKTAQVHSETAVSQLQNNLFNEPSTQDLNVEQVFQKYPFELLESMAGWIQDYFQSSGGPPTDEIDQLMNLLRQKTSPPRVEDIQRHFLSASRLHYEQHVFRLNERTTSLQAERDRLQFQLSEMHGAMQKVLDGLEQDNDEETQNMRTQEFGQADKIQYRKKTTALGDESERSQTQKTFVKRQQETGFVEATLVKRVNEALSERVRDIKLILNRRYFELEDSMKLQKENYEQEIRAMKVQFGKDLNLVHLDNKKALALQRKDTAEKHKNDVVELKNQLGDQFKKLKADFEEQLKKINKEKIEERVKKENYFSELKKQKNESTGLYQGAFGTFSIAFENPLHTKLAKCQQQLVECQKEMEGIKASLTGAKSKIRNKAMQVHLEKEDMLQKQCAQILKAMEEIEILPKEKLDHFIQVGFQMSSRNFLPLITYNEHAYESIARKYVFEFQDPLEPNQDYYENEKPIPADCGLLQVENKFRQQISDNFALFNEINPIYVSLNMGRPVSSSLEISLPIEKFRLAERLSANIASQYLTVNFMKTDLPFKVLRLVAFNNQNCQSYELDLTKEDLLVFLEGNTRLIEEENSGDLYQMLLNSLTLISRTTQTRAGPFTYQVLAIEHRCFFNELYRQHWDARNKHIKARHNKIKQGLVNEVSIMTNFEQSLVYEGFAPVFDTEVEVEVDKDTADHFQICLLRGVHSGHLKLVTKLLYAKDVEQTLCLVKSELAKQGKVQNIAAALLQKPEIGDNTQAIAYIVSMEMVFGSGSEESIIIKLSSVQKRFADQMKSFHWQGEGTPNLASTRSVQKVIYLTSKIGEPTKYCQVNDFEILNTEVRAQLFAHAFGYNQRLVDFGDLSTNSNDSIQQDGSPRHSPSGIVRVGFEPSQSQGTNLQIESPKNNSNKQATFQNQSALKASKANQQESSDINKLIYRRFTIIRVVTVNDEDGEETVSHYAQVAFFTNQRLQEQQLLEIVVQVPEIDVLLQSEISPMTLLSVEEFQNFTAGNKTEEYASTLIDQLAVVLKKDKSKVMLDMKLEPFSALLKQLQQQQFDENFAKIGLVQFQLEINDPKSLNISKQELLNSPKNHKVTVIGQRPFKVTCYFILQLKDKKVKQHNLFDFDCMYIQAFNQTLDRTFEVVMTEHDIGTLIEMIQEATQHKTAAEYQIDYKKLFNSSLTHQQLFNFVLDALQFNPEALGIYVSFEQLLSRLVERRKLENMFLTSGGTFMNSQQLIALSTNTQLRRKLVVMLDKDVSNSKINIKVYRCELASLPGKVKLEIEIFDLTEPDIIFKVEYLMSQENVGNQLLVERFSLTDEIFRKQNPGLSADYSENGLNRGLVLSISEAAFPHEITLMLLEPCSHIFWQYSLKDDKISRIERRADKQAFVVQLEQTLQGELTRQMNKQSCRMISSGYQKKIGSTDITFTEIVESDFNGLGAKKEGDIDLVYGKTFSTFKQGKFIEVKLSFDHRIRKLYFDWIEKLQDDSVKANFSWQYTLLQEVESSRVYQGSMRSSDGSQLICQIEQSISGSLNNRGLRITVSQIVSENAVAPIFSLVIVDPSLLKEDFNVREDVKFALGLGYKDSLATVLKMDDFARDVALSKLQLPAPPSEPFKKTETWNAAYRKIFSQGEAQFVVNALSRPDPTMFKLNVFETTSSQQHNFLFNSSDVFSKEELSILQSKPEQIKQYIVEAVNYRLVIRQFSSELQDNQDFTKLVVPESNSIKLLFSASFLNQAAVQNKQQNQVATNQIFPDIEEFDIRKNCTQSFFQPSDLFGTFTQKTKQTLLTQYVRNEKIYDVYEVMNPFKLVLKVQLYDQMTFELIASAQCDEEEIKRELEIDQKTHLLEGHLKEELAKYLVSNTNLDERRQLLFFQRSEFRKTKLTKNQPAQVS